MSSYICEVVFALLAKLMCKLWKNMPNFIYLLYMVDFQCLDIHYKVFH